MAIGSSLGLRIMIGSALIGIAAAGAGLAADDPHAPASTRVSSPPEPKSLSKSAQPRPAGKPAPETPAANPAPSAAAPSPTADDALQWLRDGNTRWAKGRPTHPNAETERRALLADQGQSPFVTILTCSDSRVPVERLFDRGVGDLFVVRVAGNVAGTSEGGTIEYGVDHLRTPLLVVMGHTKCGAVAAAVTSAEVHGQVGALIDQIRPAVERTRSTAPHLDGKDLAAAAVRENVWQSIFTLMRHSKAVRDKVKSGDLRVVGAVYDIASGTVDFMGPHPWQAELIVALDARDARQESRPRATVPEQTPHEQAGHP